MLRTPILAKEAPSYMLYCIEFGIKLYLQKGLHWNNTLEYQQHPQNLQTLEPAFALT